MLAPFVCLLALLLPQHTHAAAVFAHFMVGNVPSWNESNWSSNMKLASGYGIDGFALNIANGYEYNDLQIGNAFSTAESLFADYGFVVFFSFDYAGNGSWAEGEVISLVNQYSGSEAYYHYNSQPFVSTFEGPGNADDWTNIKAQTGCFFVPDWSSAGADVAAGLNGGIVDGLFSWAAWPYASSPMSTYIDASYSLALGDKPYMMPVSPWFFTNLPGYDKNWLWNSADLWYDRWQQAIFYSKGGYPAPEWIEIITWNDFGESHYIGPLDDSQYELFDIGKAPYNYVENMPHDGWGAQLYWLISQYKTGKAEGLGETLVAWWRTSYASSCTTDTTGNTASQLQVEYTPADIVVDQISISALLAQEPTDSTVIFGGVESDITWKYKPQGGAGLYYAVYDVPAGGTGIITISVNSGFDNLLINTESGLINSSCPQDITNWNAYVEVAYGVQNAFSQDVSDYVCVNGWGWEDFGPVCTFICEYGYCPTSACVCDQWGAQKTLPTDGGTPVNGYSLDGDPNWDGLCSFLCGLGESYCAQFNEYCSETPTPVVIPTVSPFTPNAPTSGSGLTADFDDLCNWSCKYGYCPIDECQLGTEGVLDVPPTQLYPTLKANYTPDNFWRYNDLCTWTCSRNYCPGVCSSNLGCVSGSGDGNYGGLCSFSCGRGFCPSPCTCAAMGSVPDLSDIFDPLITGHAAPGLDETTYDPLCNFACSHGYCPEPGACVAVYDGNLNITETDLPALPTLVDYDPVPNVTFSEGQFVWYSLSQPDYFMGVMTGSQPVDLADIDSSTCDVSTSGEYGSWLGCVGETLEWLLLSVFADPNSLTERDASDSTKSKSTRSWAYTPVSNWIAKSNCSTHCRLLAEAPVGTWVPVGEGHINGQVHSLHYQVTEKNNFAYRATRGHLDEASEAKSSVEKRKQIPGYYRSGYYVGSGESINPAIISLSEDKSTWPDTVSEIAGMGMTNAEEGFLHNCYYPMSNNTGVMKAGLDPAPFGLNFDPNDSVGTWTPSEIDGSVSVCDNEDGDPEQFYVVWPSDGTDVEDLRALLLTFDSAMEEHVALNLDLGTLYFRAHLTMTQALQVTAEKQCYGVEINCADGCPDPSFWQKMEPVRPLNDLSRFDVKTRKADQNFSILRERDQGFTTQFDVVPELGFVSAEAGGGLTTYTHDLSNGDGIKVYVVDPGAFDLSLPVFSGDVDSNGETILEKWQHQNVPPSFSPPSPATGPPAHGTSMLQQVVGSTYGIARNAKPFGVSVDLSNGRQWSVDALDVVLNDWRTWKSKTGSPVAVLSLSWGVGREQFDVFNDGFVRRFSDLLKMMADEGIFLVSAAGNSGTDISSYPSLFGDSTSPYYVPSLMVVSGVKNDGTVWQESSLGSWIAIWAPAYQVAIQGWVTTTTTGTWPFDGTSVAAAKVAGVAAYFLGLSSLDDTLTTPLQLYNYILTVAVTRYFNKNIYNNAPPPP
ncbi:glycosyl hydrolase family 71-domain-containing protein [Xylariaceae sp. FL0255]|nr:glycosyl hydrolase family 71-domain-containing protein [Xylariaceae sp. FL0255]